MCDTKVDKTKGVSQDVVAAQLKTLKESKEFNKKVEKYVPPNAVVKAAAYSSKGNSLIKFPVMGSTQSVPSQSLPVPAASTKPAPPVVPPKPVTFSGSLSAAVKAHPSLTVKTSNTSAAQRK